MYTFDGSTWSVGEPRPHYGDDGIEPERFPAELALRDLGGPDGERAAALILARYAALRAWWLATVPTEAGLLEHAVDAAHEYIAAAPDDWVEGALLDRLLEREPVAVVSAVLLEVAAAAERLGHVDGAFAARTAAWTAEVRAIRLEEAAAVAADTATFLRRWGGAVDAADWDKAARRLRRAASGWDRPSMS